MALVIEISAPERIEPPHFTDERGMLAAYLDYHRATLAMKCAGLTLDQLRERAVPPSSMSLLGLVRHMADVERGWFRRTAAGLDAPPLFYSEQDLDGEFDNVDTADPDEAFAAWRAECEFAQTFTATAESLDVESKLVRPNGPHSLRWILAHMLEEYARHNGHADLLRERIDGATGE
jgi:uncharacterized damage-inducible protein DinB